MGDQTRNSALWEIIRAHPVAGVGAGAAIVSAVPSIMIAGAGLSAVALTIVGSVASAALAYDIDTTQKMRVAKRINRQSKSAPTDAEVLS